MTREELINAIDNDLELCPDRTCNLPEGEGNTGDCCRKCAERKLTDYETRIRADERRKVLDEVIKLFSKMRPSLATHISDFGDKLEQMKDGEQNDE